MAAKTFLPIDSHVVLTINTATTAIAVAAADFLQINAYVLVCRGTPSSLMYRFAVEQIIFLGTREEMDAREAAVLAVAILAGDVDNASYIASVQGKSALFDTRIASAFLLADIANTSQGASVPS